jgi:NRPS condensation-like uncharacterized protein
LDGPQWRLFLKENYEDGKSLFILKMHHVVTDGYGMSVFLANVMDTFDEKVLPHLPVMTSLQKVMMWLSIPYHWIKMAIEFVPYPSDNNPITWNTPYNSGEKKGLFAKEFSVEAIKKKSAQHKVTINDLIMTVISMTMKQYFLSKGDEKSHRILMFIPYNFREKPADKSDFSFNNQIAVLPVILDLVNDFPNGV